MKHYFSRLSGIFLISVSFVMAEGVPVEPKAAPPVVKPTPPTDKKLVKAKTERFETRLELEGFVESKTNTAIRINPKSWADLTVLDVVDHGTVVKKGDVIMRFETDKLLLAIEDLEASLPLAKVKLETSKTDLALLEKTAPLQFENQRRNQSEKEADFVYFEKVQRPQNERSARERLKSAENYLLYNEEELKQLKKMYENDDMTEETEEIILKRAQDEVDRGKWSLELTKGSTDRSLNVFIPREHESLQQGLKISQLEWEQAEARNNRNFTTKKLEIEDLERSLAKNIEKIADLKGDLDSLVVKAPHDGVVYYGTNVKGKWNASMVDRKLVPGGKAMPGETLVTVADPNQLQVQVAVAEADLRDLKPGLKSRLSLKWNPTIKLDSSVVSLSYVPDASSTFPTVFSLDKSRSTLPIFPGMGVKLNMDTYLNENALLVPLKAVKTEGDKSYVIKRDGTKLPVELGRADKENQEILNGLSAGDEIEADLSIKTDVKK